MEVNRFFFLILDATDGNNLERIQQKFSALRFHRLFPHVHYSYALP
jgi:hypothetical protein